MKQATTIKFTVEQLASTLPEFVDRFREGQVYRARIENGWMTGRIRGGKFEGHNESDGVLTQTDDAAKQTLAAQLKKRGADAKTIEEAIKAYEEAQFGQLISLP